MPPRLCSYMLSLCFFPSPFILYTPKQESMLLHSRHTSSDYYFSVLKSLPLSTTILAHGYIILCSEQSQGTLCRTKARSIWERGKKHRSSECVSRCEFFLPLRVCTHFSNEETSVQQLVWLSARAASHCLRECHWLLNPHTGSIWEIVLFL